MKTAPAFNSRFNFQKRRGLFMLVAFLLLIASAFSFASGEKRGEQVKAKRAIVISLDGLDARYLNRRDEFGLKIPNLRRLMSEGATARGVVSVFPSVTSGRLAPRVVLVRARHTR
jgi:predicted AlkP superfamily pyrophosphatase or phosphodiesterase